MTTPRERIGELLEVRSKSETFVASALASPEDLDLRVEGVGRIALPVTHEVAEALCGVAQLAKYGLGEDTLLDREVRDTWEIPTESVELAGERWDRALEHVLDSLRADLGLAEGSQLAAELHSMLVYAPGQFFLPHRDSEKEDGMVATLVVTLPSTFRGGTFVVEHGGRRVSYRGSASRLSFVAFYADCRHEVRPVKEGYRVVLTYNLLLRGEAGVFTDEELVEELAEELAIYFDSPRPPRWGRGDDPPRDPPNRLVYLLDHAYTERGLDWKSLKGSDARRATMLRAAGERYGCETALALAEIEETWQCMEPGWDDHWTRRHRHWTRNDEGLWEEDDPPLDGPEAYELTELIDGGMVLDHWVTEDEHEEHNEEPQIRSRVGDDETAWSTPTVDIDPYASEYEGYMGNYGCTMDRWYRRAAIVLWPRRRAFAVRAEASPGWGLGEVRKLIESDEVGGAREKTRSLLPFWNASVSWKAGTSLAGDALSVAADLHDAELAAALLRPFRVEDLAIEDAASWVALTDQHGEVWAQELVGEWRITRHRSSFDDRIDLDTWIGAFPRFCETLFAADEDVGVDAARPLWTAIWPVFEEDLRSASATSHPRTRVRRLSQLAPALLALLESAAALGQWDLRDTVLRRFSSAERPAEYGSLLALVMPMLRAAAEHHDAEAREALGLHLLESETREELDRLLAEPPREDGDWSISLPKGCDCDICGTLAQFLADSEEARLEWPIAKDKRKHVHRRIDAHGLPVRHETRRSGRPYTLVLEKTLELFTVEENERRRWREDSDWLRELAPA